MDKNTEMHITNLLNDTNKTLDIKPQINKTKDTLNFLHDMSISELQDLRIKVEYLLACIAGTIAGKMSNI